MKNVLTVMVLSFIVFSLNARADDFSITIDAERDIWYYQLTGPEDGLVFMPAECHLLDIGDGTGPDDDADCSAIVWFSYDPNYLYCYAEIKDDAAGVFSGTRYQNDCIELKLDPDPTVGSTDGTCDLRLTVKDKDDAENSSGVDNLNGSNRMRDLDGGSWEPAEDDYARRLTEDGYALEFRIPLDVMNASDGRSLQNNTTDTFGLAINIADNDEGTRTDMLQWSAGHSDAAFNQPPLLGSATFRENHIIKLEAVSPIDPSIVNENADDWYSNPNVTAWAPNPADGSIDVPRDKVLCWMKGKYPVVYDVYLGKDFNDVNEATKDNPLDVLISIAQEDSTCNTDALDLGQTYYWRIDEIDEADPNNPLKGDILSFFTRDYVTIDDFEAYNDINEDVEGSNRIYLTWSDGYNNPNVNGSVIGYPDPVFSNDEHFVEANIVHGGKQSGPFLYDNTTASYSEVTLPTSATAVGSDWTKDGVNVLSLWFYGDPNNPATESLYVKLNSSRITYGDDAADISAGQWIQWDINLSDFGITLTNVTQLTIGTERAGATGSEGILFLDDIRLCIVEQ